jgi:large subunit ribosomal protein L32
MGYSVANMVVRMRVNRSKTGKRRSHLAISQTRSAVCECGALRRPHRACANCGKYNGNVAVDVVARTKREQRRNKKKEQELKASGQPTEKKETEAAAA